MWENRREWINSVYLSIYSICNSDLCLALVAAGAPGAPSPCENVPGALAALTPTPLTARLGGHALEAGGCWQQAAKPGALIS